MTMKEFLDKYYLHDSFFNTVDYNPSKRELTLLIDFCFWMQDDYVEGEPENGFLRAVFHDVESYSCPDGDPCGKFTGILEAEINEQGECVILISDDAANNCFEMHISARDVTVTPEYEGYE